MAIVGAGAVGATLAYASLIRGVAHDVVLYDMNAAKVEAEVLDLRHGLLFCPPAEVSGSDDVSICAGADVVAITAGAKQKPGQTRLELAGTNVDICRALIPKLLDVAPDAVIVMVTNPVDVLTLAAQKFSGLPPHRVLGSGTVLDSARLRDLIARHLGVASRRAFTRSSPVSTGIRSSRSGAVRRWEPFRCRTSRCRAETVWTTPRRIGSPGKWSTAAERIIRGKGATNYAVGLAATRVIEAILRDENSVQPVSSLLDGRYGMHDVCLSLPSIVNRGGVATMLDVPMNDKEIGLLQGSAREVRAVAASLGL